MRTRLTDEHIRVLLALVHIHGTTGRVTGRAVAALLGMPYGRAYRRIRQLEMEGFVAWPPGGHRGGLRPLVRVVRNVP